MYTALEKFGVTCIGARLPSVGVGGFLLGGGTHDYWCLFDSPTNQSTGYGWLSNQLGLGIDNILAYELVLPTGEVVEVTEAARPDLFFALKVCRHLQIMMLDVILTKNSVKGWIK